MTKDCLKPTKRMIKKLATKQPIQRRQLHKAQCQFTKWPCCKGRELLCKSEGAQASGTKTSMQPSKGVWGNAPPESFDPQTVFLRPFDSSLLLLCVYTEDVEK